jgi:hypothetical protein
MKSSTKTESLATQKSSTKLLPRVLMHSTAQTFPAASKIFNEIFSTGDAWIRKRKQPLRHQKSSLKVLPRVTHGFDSANSPRVSESINKTASTGDAIIRQRKQPMWD